MNNNEPMTLQEISDIEGVSKQRVAEILANALRKLRIALEKRGIEMEDLL
jgi:DNA-directed RNA polymerase sigma subunit (sigma70/sigma32)